MFKMYQLIKPHPQESTKQALIKAELDPEYTKAELALEFIRVVQDQESIRVELDQESIKQEADLEFTNQAPTKAELQDHLEFTKLEHQQLTKEAAEPQADMEHLQLTKLEADKLDHQEYTKAEQADLINPINLDQQASQAAINLEHTDQELEPLEHLELQAASTHHPLTNTRRNEE